MQSAMTAQGRIVRWVLSGMLLAVAPARANPSRNTSSPLGQGEAGEFLLDTAGWRWIFFLNLPIAVFAMFITFRVVGKDQPDRTGQRIDYAGKLHAKD